MPCVLQQRRQACAAGVTYRNGRETGRASPEERGAADAVNVRGRSERRNKSRGIKGRIVREGRVDPSLHKIPCRRRQVAGFGIASCEHDTSPAAREIESAT